jgi:hypothetical protein
MDYGNRLVGRGEVLEAFSCFQQYHILRWLQNLHSTLPIPRSIKNERLGVTFYADREVMYHIPTSRRAPFDRPISFLFGTCQMAHPSDGVKSLYRSGGARRPGQRCPSPRENLEFTIHFPPLAGSRKVCGIEILRRAVCMPTNSAKHE